MIENRPRSRFISFLAMSAVFIAAVLPLYYPLTSTSLHPQWVNIFSMVGMVALVTTGTYLFWELIGWVGLCFQVAGKLHVHAGTAIINVQQLIGKSVKRLTISILVSIQKTIREFINSIRK